MRVVCVACEHEFSLPTSGQDDRVACPYCGKRDRLYLGRMQFLEGAAESSPASQAPRVVSPGRLELERHGAQVADATPARIPGPSIPRVELSSPRKAEELRIVAPTVPAAPARETPRPPAPPPPPSPYLGMTRLGRNPQGFDEWRHEKDGTVLVEIPRSTFTMGSDGGEDDEKPPQTIVLQPHFFGKLPVTNAQFAQFIAETGYRTEAELGDGGWVWRNEWVEVPGSCWRHPQGPDTIAEGRAPVVQVSWNDAVAYVRLSTPYRKKSPDILQAG